MQIDIGHDDPQLELLQAKPHETDKTALRRRARALSAALGSDRHISRSYAFPYALIAHHDTAVGVDIERVTPCAPTFATSICTPSELQHLHLEDDAAVISLWSPKEALAKALGDARLYDPRRLQAPIGWTDGVAGPWRARALTPAPGFRGWVCWQVGADTPNSRAWLPSRDRRQRQPAEPMLSGAQRLSPDPSPPGHHKA